MYAPAAEIEEFLATHRDKPYVLCEYAHAMGNSFGAVHKYLDLAYREPLFQGGFIWDFADQALAAHRPPAAASTSATAATSATRRTTRDFSGNGIVFADRTLKPLAQEVRYLYQGYRLSVGSDKVTVENRHLATSSSAHECVVTARPGGPGAPGGGARDRRRPGGLAGLRAPGHGADRGPGEYTVDVSFRLRRTTRWASAGHEVAHEQTVVVVAGLRRRPAGPPRRRSSTASTTWACGGGTSPPCSRGCTAGCVSYRYGLTRGRRP